jgi:hypothetical protein
MKKEGKNICVERKERGGEEKKRRRSALNSEEDEEEEEEARITLSLDWAARNNATTDPTRGPSQCSTSSCPNL